MRPNIIFILIDGLRSEQFYGNNRTCKTPNIDSLVRKGMYFEQAISSADGTIISLNTIFSSNFQVANAARSQKIVLNEDNLIDILKKMDIVYMELFPILFLSIHYGNVLKMKITVMIGSNLSLRLKLYPQD